MFASAALARGGTGAGGAQPELKAWMSISTLWLHPHSILAPCASTFRALEKAATVEAAAARRAGGAGAGAWGVAGGDEGGSGADDAVPAEEEGGGGGRKARRKQRSSSSRKTERGRTTDGVAGQEGDLKFRSEVNLIAPFLYLVYNRHRGHDVFFFLCFFVSFPTSSRRAHGPMRSTAWHAGDSHKDACVRRVCALAEDRVRDNGDFLPPVTSPKRKVTEEENRHFSRAGVTARADTWRTQAHIQLSHAL